MNIIIFGVILVILWLLIEILAIVFKITGLDLNKARFQVISIMTHTGFTTRESELIAQHPLRRKLASLLMLISYIAQASLISLLFNTVSQNIRDLLYILAAIAGFFILIMFVTRNKYVSGKVEKVVERFIEKRIMKKVKGRSIDQVLKISPGYAVYEILVTPESFLANTTLRNAKLHEKFIHVLKIDRGSGTVDFPNADFMIQPGDGLIVYGKIKSIKDLDLARSVA